MKKFITNLIIFSLYSFLIYLIAVFIWGNYAPNVLKPNLKYPIGSIGHLYSRLKEVKTVNNVDILFLGSSHSIRGFNTKDFKTAGYNTFNLGTKAGTPLQTLTLLNRYLDQLKPKLVVYEVYPVTFELDGVEASLHLLANDRTDKHSFELAVKQNHIKTYNTLFYGTVRDLLNKNNSFTEDFVKGKDTYFSGGYVERSNYYWRPHTFKSHQIKINQKQLDCFESIMKIFENNNIEVVLVYVPISPLYYKSFSNTDYFDSLMKSYSEYYNFNKIITLNDSLHFYDADHLNKAGVDKFTPKLIDILENRKLSYNKI